MKLTNLQKHYNNTFKKFRNVFNDRFGSSIYNPNKSLLQLKELNPVSKRMLHNVKCKILSSYNYSTSKISPEDKINHLELEYIVQGKPCTILFSHTCALHSFEKDINLFFEWGILYKPRTAMSTELHDLIDWDKEYSEEELFQQSTVHNLNIPYLQELYRLHKTIISCYDSNNNITINSIYLALSNYNRGIKT